MDLVPVLHDIFIIFQNPHPTRTYPAGVASVTVTLKPAFAR